MTTQVWLDLETTGLDAKEGAILEVGFIVVTEDGSEVEFEAVVGGLGSDWEDLMPEVVVEMHMATGLFDQVNGEGSLPLDQIEGLAIDVLDQFGERGDFWLCGSGVIEFDRVWLNEHMPRLAEWFHYRTIDMGVIRRWLALIGVTEQWEFTRKDELVAHRALDDAQSALDEHRWFSKIVGDGAVMPLKVCPFDCDGCHGEGCPCARGGCDGDTA